MGCQRAIPISQAVPPGELPLDDAIYDPVSGFIFGTSGNCLCRFNASTGVYIDQVVITRHCYQPLTLTAIAGTVYVGTWDATADTGIFGPTSHPHADIFPVNPLTMAVGTALGISAHNMYAGSENSWESGGRILGTFGGYILYEWDAYDFSITRYISGVQPGTPSVYQPALWYNAYAYCGTNSTVQVAMDASNFYQVDSNFCGINKVTPPDFQNGAWVDYPIGADYEWKLSLNGIVYVPPVNKLYMFGRPGHFLALNSWTDNDVTDILMPLTGTVIPTHVRYIGTLLYIADPNNDRVATLEPVSGVFMEYNGLHSPFDIISTGSKIWAVQSYGPEPLKELI